MRLCQLILAAAVATGSFLSVAAQASTCTPTGGGGTDGLSVTQASSFSTCDGTNGNGSFSPASGYTQIATDTPTAGVLTGSFTGLGAYTSFELFIQTDTGPPHDDQIWAIFSGTGVSGEIDWSFVNGGSNNVDDVVLYGIAATPLPGALPLLAGGIGFLGLLMRSRKRRGMQAVGA